MPVGVRPFVFDEQELRSAIGLFYVAEWTNEGLAVVRKRDDKRLAVPRDAPRRRWLPPWRRNICCLEPPMPLPCRFSRRDDGSKTFVETSPVKCRAVFLFDAQAEHPHPDAAGFGWSVGWSASAPWRLMKRFGHDRSSCCGFDSVVIGSAPVAFNVRYSHAAHHPSASINDPRQPGREPVQSCCGAARVLPRVAHKSCVTRAVRLRLRC